MIHVDPQPEPEDFNEKVRIPGNQFLERTPSPKSKDWRHNSYWSRCSNDLYSAYNGICAYTGEWFSNSSFAPSVDHFYPKSLHSELAYEWSNYRLTTQKMNSYKGDKIVLDPFHINNGDLTIDFPSCLIKPNTTMTPAAKSKAWSTITILHLNDEEMLNNRYEIVMDYANGNVNRMFLKKRYPFIESELVRQNLLETVGERFKSLPSKKQT